MDREHSRKARRKIEEATFFLLKTREFDDTSVEQICHQAELSRATFYRYFEDKYDVVLQYVEYTLLQSLKPMFTQEALCQYLDTFIMPDSMNRTILRLINSRGNRELQSKLYQTYNMHYVKFYQENIACTAQSDVFAKMMSEYTCAGAIHLINWWIDADFPVSSKVLAQFISNMMESSVHFPDIIISND